MRRPLVLLAAGIVLAGPFALGYGFARQPRDAAPARIPTVVDRVREALAARYYRSVPTRVLRLDSVGAMISALGDPYTAYLAPLDYRLVRQETAARYSGIGVSVLPSRGGLVVAALRPGRSRRAFASGTRSSGSAAHPPRASARRRRWPGSSGRAGRRCVCGYAARAACST